MTLIQYADLSRTIDVRWTTVSSSTSLQDVLNYLCGDWELTAITISGRPVSEDGLQKAISEMPLRRLPEGKFYVQIEKHG